MAQLCHSINYYLGNRAVALLASLQGSASAVLDELPHLWFQDDRQTCIVQYVQNGLHSMTGRLRAGSKHMNIS
jgi:hypothetical protein